MLAITLATFYPTLRRRSQVPETTMKLHPLEEAIIFSWANICHPIFSAIQIWLQINGNFKAVA